MKKIVIALTFIISTYSASAQDGYHPFSDKELIQETLRSVIIVGVLYLLTTFILAMVKLYLENRLKKTMLEKGTSENIIAQLLPKKKQEKYTVLKWFILPAAIGIGLLIASLFQPFGFHSVVIMIFSISLGFLGYYFLIKHIDE
jgi:uncharacterized membrane protein